MKWHKIEWYVFFDVKDIVTKQIHFFFSIEVRRKYDSIALLNGITISHHSFPTMGSSWRGHVEKKNLENWKFLHQEISRLNSIL